MDSESEAPTKHRRTDTSRKEIILITIRQRENAFIGCVECPHDKAKIFSGCI